MDQWDALDAVFAGDKPAPTAKRPAAPAQQRPQGWDALDQVFADSSPSQPAAGGSNFVAGVAAKNSAEPMSAKPTIGDRAKATGYDPGKDLVGQAVNGIGELALQSVSGLYGTAKGVLSGAVDWAKGDFGNVRPSIEAAQSDATYQPRSPVGSAVNRYVLEPIGSVLHRVSEYGEGAVTDAFGPRAGSAVPLATNAVAAGLGVRMGVPKGGIAPKALRVAGDEPTGLMADVTRPAARIEPTFTDRPGVAAPAQEAGAVGPNPGSRGATAAASLDTAPYASGGSAASTLRSQFNSATPEMQQAVLSRLSTGGEAHPVVLQRHLEADSLPVPVKLTKGQATAEVTPDGIAQLSREQNLRGQHQEIGQFFNKQDHDLVANFDAIRDQVGPDVYGATPGDIGQSILDIRKTEAAADKKYVGSLYEKLKDANGGEYMPLDGPTFAQNADKALKAELKEGYVPPQIQKVVDAMGNGQQLTLGQYEALRSDLASISRTNPDGSVRNAAGIIRSELEKLPLPPEAAGLKDLADAARKAAAKRFAKEEADPMYRAAAMDKTPIGERSPLADNFLDKYVLGAKRAHIDRARQHMQEAAQAGLIDPALVDMANQAMAVGAVNWLKDKTLGTKGVFNHATFHRSLAGLREINSSILPPDALSALHTLDKVGGYVTKQPKGSYVNNSGTLVGALAEKSAAAAASAADAARIPVVGALIRKGVSKSEQMKGAKWARESIEPAAGVGAPMKELLR